MLPKFFQTASEFFSCSKNKLNSFIVGFSALTLISKSIVLKIDLACLPSFWVPLHFVLKVSPYPIAGPALCNIILSIFKTLSFYGSHCLCLQTLGLLSLLQCSGGRVVPKYALHLGSHLFCSLTDVTYFW